MGTIPKLLFTAVICGLLIGCFWPGVFTAVLRALLAVATGGMAG